MIATAMAAFIAALTRCMAELSTCDFPDKMRLQENQEFFPLIVSVSYLRISVIFLPIHC